MTIGDMVLERVNEISFILSLGVCAWFYGQFRKMEIQQQNEELLDQLFSDSSAK